MTRKRQSYAMVHSSSFLYNYIRGERDGSDQISDRKRRRFRLRRNYKRDVSLMARWEYYNPNPRGRKTGDCVIRAVCAATGKSWDEVYTGVALTGYAMEDMPSGNHVWRAYLRSLGFRRKEIPDTCPDCYTVGDFADDHPRGRYVLGCGTHAVGIVDGKIKDLWDSSELPVLYFYYKE